MASATRPPSRREIAMPTCTPGAASERSSRQVPFNCGTARAASATARTNRAAGSRRARGRLSSAPPASAPRREVNCLLEVVGISRFETTHGRGDRGASPVHESRRRALRRCRWRDGCGGRRGTARSTSARVTAPPGPLPRTASMSTPSRRAVCRARGETRRRAGSGDRTDAGTAGGPGAPASEDACDSGTGAGGGGRDATRTGTPADSERIRASGADRTGPGRRAGVHDARLEDRPDAALRSRLPRSRRRGTGSPVARAIRAAPKSMSAPRGTRSQPRCALSAVRGARGAPHANNAERGARGARPTQHHREERVEAGHEHVCGDHDRYSVKKTGSSGRQRTALEAIRTPGRDHGHEPGDRQQPQPGQRQPEQPVEQAVLASDAMNIGRSSCSCVTRLSIVAEQWRAARDQGRPESGLPPAVRGAPTSGGGRAGTAAASATRVS
jgi:hypothetical protein